MAKIKVIYDHLGNTLDVWFVEPQKAICEEVGHGVILKKDSRGKVLGFEKLNFLPKFRRLTRKKDLRVESVLL